MRRAGTILHQVIPGATELEEYELTKRILLVLRSPPLPQTAIILPYPSEDAIAHIFVHLEHDLSVIIQLGVIV